MGGIPPRDGRVLPPPAGAPRTTQTKAPSHALPGGAFKMADNVAPRAWRPDAANVTACVDRIAADLQGLSAVDSRPMSRSSWGVGVNSVSRWARSSGENLKFSTKSRPFSLRYRWITSRWRRCIHKGSP